MNIKDIEPTKGHLLVEIPLGATEAGGIILAGDQANSAPITGEVLRIPKSGSPFKVGETIFFRKYAIDELNFSDADLNQIDVYLVDEDEVLGVVRPEDAPSATETEEELKALSKDGDKKLSMSDEEKKVNIEDITIKDVLSWIIENCDDEEAMTKVAVTAYPYSTKFKTRYPDRQPDVDVHT